MKTLLLLIAICLVSISATSQPQPKTFEYKFVYQCDEKKTNSMSNDGWELTDMSMGVYGSMGVATCVFKRPK